MNKNLKSKIASKMSSMNPFKAKIANAQSFPTKIGTTTTASGIPFSLSPSGPYGGMHLPNNYFTKNSMPNPRPDAGYGAGAQPFDPGYNLTPQGVAASNDVWNDPAVRAAGYTGGSMNPYTRF